MFTDYTITVSGQGKLVKLVRSFSFETFPSAVLLTGPKGCGKHLLSRYIAGHLDVPIEELDNKLNQDEVLRIIDNVDPCVYVVDLDNALPKTQNTLLKLLEEPPATAKFVCLCSTSEHVLPTLMNRCTRWFFEPYGAAALELFISHENADKKAVLLSIADTPGQILKWQDCDLDTTVSFMDSVLDNIERASYTSVFRIPDKIAFKKSDTDKFDLDLIVRVLTRCIFKRVLSSQSIKYTKAFELVQDLPRKLDFSIIKQRAFEEFLFDLKEIMSHED